LVVVVLQEGQDPHSNPDLAPALKEMAHNFKGNFCFTPIQGGTREDRDKLVKNVLTDFNEKVMKKEIYLLDSKEFANKYMVDINFNMGAAIGAFTSSSKRLPEDASGLIGRFLDRYSAIQLSMTSKDAHARAKLMKKTAEDMEKKRAEQQNQKSRKDENTGEKSIIVRKNNK
jgi:hypothetical protein